LSPSQRALKFIVEIAVTERCIGVGKEDICEQGRWEMKTIILILLFICLMFPFEASADSTLVVFPDLSGKWQMCRQSGECYADVTLNMSGNQLTGEFYHRKKDFKLPIIGTIEGKELKLRMYFNKSEVLWRKFSEDIRDALLATGDVYELFVFPLDSNINDKISDGVFYTWWCASWERKDGRVVIKEFWQAGDPRGFEKKPPAKGYFLKRE
jgi:hypothetical protein